MTVSRRFQSKQGLVEVVISREVRHGMDELDHGGTASGRSSSGSFSVSRSQ